MQGKSGNTTVTSFYSNSRKKVTVRPTIHTDPSKKQSLLKLKTLAFAFSYQSKTTENGNGKLMINEVILPAQVSLGHKSKMTSDCTLCVQIKHLMHFFREKTPFSNFSGIVWIEPKHPFNQCLHQRGTLFNLIKIYFILDKMKPLLENLYIKYKVPSNVYYLHLY